MDAGAHYPSDIAGLIKAALLSRRGFMSVSTAAAAGYTLAAGPVRAAAISTGTDGIDTGDAKVNVSGGDMPVYFSRPQNVQNPPVILVAMEIFGLHEYIKDVTRRLARLGAFAVAPDYYFRSGDLAKISAIEKLKPLVNAKPDSELLADLNASVEWANKQGGDTNRLGIVGFCRGGRTVWEFCATNGDVRAGVAFYGSLVDPPSQKPIWPKSPTDLAPDMRAPVLGLYGEADQGIPVTQVETMKAALLAAGKTAEFIIYPGAPHGFHADYRSSYHEPTAHDAWQRTGAWFKQWGVLN
ncbi:MAG: dienelactone hydrolase family protein [Hyphomicrobium sp.]